MSAAREDVSVQTRTSIDNGEPDLEKAPFQGLLNWN